MPEAK